jgi:hypothetical protein
MGGLLAVSSMTVTVRIVVTDGNQLPVASW